MNKNKTSKLKINFSKLAGRYGHKYLIKRLVSTIAVYFVSIIIIFIIPHLMKGNIAYLYVSRMISTNPQLSYTTALKIIESEYGLNKPISVQFIEYMHNVAFSFPPNFGSSFEYFPVSAWHIVAVSLPFTLLLIIVSQVISWGISIFLGVFLALRKDHLPDKSSTPLLYFVHSTPIFWIGMIFILLFAIDIHIFPVEVSIGITSSLPSILYAMELPILVVVVSTIPQHTLVIRSASIDFLQSDFVVSLRAMGLKGRTFLMKIMRNALLPSITQFFLSFGYLIGGIYVIEAIFDLPGMGTVIVDAALDYDFPVLEAGLYLTALVMIIANLIADLIYPLLDPRVAYT